MVLDTIEGLDQRTEDGLTELIEHSRFNNDITQLRTNAKQAFWYINPRLNTDILFSYVKDFRQLGTSVQDAERGIHVIRTWFAHRIHEAHRRHVGYKGPVGQEFDKSGIIQYYDYFPEPLVNRIKKEMESIPLSVNKQSWNIIMNIKNNDSALREAVFGRELGAFTGMRTHVFDCLGLSLTHGEAKRCYAENTFVQKLHNKAGDGDIQKVLHQDTFFPCLKFWYFPKEVTLDDGPFAYAVGSHELTPARLRYIYQQSILCAKGEIEEGRTESHIEGSIRIFEPELEEMGYKVTQFPVPANTLVVGNVFGFHRRSEVTQEGFRDSIHGSIRINNPFD